ncbi:P-II family nitrogen regulator [Clostridium thermarum]|uniref:P-II family nitrogen regulator n=1 Tax=Clostridium thermarum TaxID=1716543 RepID=UPI0013D82C59|nr:P-II family nitrogen regulator [Clostridium thermarum]
MKHLKAVIQPDKLSDVREALDAAGCSGGIIISEVMGHGNQKGIVQAWRGEKYQVDLLPKVMIDLVIKDEDLETVKKIIIDSARVGEFGDGKIFIYNVESVIRIRTGEEDDDAL